MSMGQRKPVGWMLEAGRAFCRAGLDFFYPPTCVQCGCSDVMNEDERFARLADGLIGPAGSSRRAAGPAFAVPAFCAACRENLVPRIAHSCSRCAAPVGPHLDTAEGCIHCRHDRFAFDGVIRLGVYEGLLRSACLKAKQAGAEPLAAALAALLLEREAAAFAQTAVDVVVPVPRHWRQRVFQPHNAAVTLADRLAGCLKAPIGRHILAKARWTPSQAGLSPKERRRNLRGAFRVWDASRLIGRSVLLVDDILTTGTTAHRASQVLKEAGAKHVTVAVVARGLG